MHRNILKCLLPSKEVISNLGSLHWPSLAIVSIPPLHILVA